MDARDVGRVLTKAAAFDQRTVGEGDILAWLEAVGDLDLDDALTAVTLHYRETAEFLRPAHLRRIINELDRQRKRSQREAAEQLAIESYGAQRTEDRAADVTRLVQQLRDALGDYDRTALRRPEWVREDRHRARVEPEPNPLYRGPPPTGGWPMPGDPAGDLADPSALLQPSTEGTEQ